MGGGVPSPTRPGFGQQLRSNRPRLEHCDDGHPLVFVNDEGRRMFGSCEGQWGDWKLGSQNKDVECAAHTDRQVHECPTLESDFLEGAKLDLGMDDFKEARPSVRELGWPAPLSR